MILTSLRKHQERPGASFFVTYTEFQRQLGKAGLSIRAFADLVKMNSNSISNYSKAGEVPAHLGVIAALMGEMAERGIDFRSALARIDIEPKKPRGRRKVGQLGIGRQRDLNFKS